MTGGLGCGPRRPGEPMPSPVRPAEGLSRTPSRAPQLRDRPSERGKWLPSSLVAVPARDVRPWMVPIGIVLIIGGVGGGAFAEGPLPGPTLVFTIGLLVLAAACWAIGLSRRFRDLRVVIPVLIVLGLCGAALDWPQSDGPGFVAGYMALAGLALRVRRGVALLAGLLIVAAIAVSEAHEAERPASTVLAVALGCGFLFVTSALAALSQDAHHRAEALLVQENAIRDAREQMARLAERSRLARELHDVLAHALSSLSLQLEGARLRASQTAADPMLLEQISYARQMACDGMVSAQRALQALRGDGDEVPGLAGLPRLVSGTAVAVGIPIDFRAEGTPRPLRPEAELTAYRTVQEALTNVAKHAGRGAQARVLLTWAPDSLDISVADSGGDGVDAGLVSSGFGLISMAERAALHGGQLTAGPSADGFTVQLRLPLGQLPRMVRS
jgi:signal transduction histidine kinase